MITKPHKKEVFENAEDLKLLLKYELRNYNLKAAGSAFL